MKFIQNSLKFVPKDPSDNKTALVLTMAWFRTCDKPLSEPMMTEFIPKNIIEGAAPGWMNNPSMTYSYFCSNTAVWHIDKTYQKQSDELPYNLINNTTFYVKPNPQV